MDVKKLVDILHEPEEGRKPRTYRRRVQKDYLKYARTRKHTVKLTHKAIGKQLRYPKRDLAAIDEKLRLGKTLKSQQQEQHGDDSHYMPATEVHV